jgi:ribulose-5-phosphate 4-epimerase/fuculose-1-phosphate aldolase
MCLQRGRKPTIEEFKNQVLRNLDNLTVWHNIGTDVDHGEWAIAGSRQGTYMTMLTNWDYKQVQDFAALESLWNTVKDSNPRILSNQLGPELSTQLDLPMAILEAEQSAFFKYHYRSDWRNHGVMTREIDVIRQQEGW